VLRSGSRRLERAEKEEEPGTLLGVIGGERERRSAPRAL
jgi:hypothetical protein